MRIVSYAATDTDDLHASYHACAMIICDDGKPHPVRITARTPELAEEAARQFWETELGRFREKQGKIAKVAARKRREDAPAPTPAPIPDYDPMEEAI